MALQVEQLVWSAENRGHEVAYRRVDTGEELTFGEWDAAANRLARGLRSAGVGTGDRVSIYLDGDRVHAWIISYAAVHKAGAVAVPTNTRLTPQELATVLGHAEPVAVITSAELARNLVPVRQQLPSVTTVVEVDTGGLEAAMSEDDSPFQEQVGEDDLADIMYTSGTTGVPKGIAVRHANLHILPNGEPEWTGAEWIHSSPLFTFAGISFIYNPMKMGMACNYMPRFDAERWLDTVEQRRPTMAFLVPAMAQLIATSDRFEEADLSSLEMVAIGSAPLPASLHRRLAHRLPEATVSNNYSLTEAGTAFAFLPREELDRRAGSVGIPIGTEVRIVDPVGSHAGADDSGGDPEPLPPGEIGEVMIHVGDRHREYFRDPEATAQTWSGEWLRSGDLGWLDEDGYLYITGRAKDVIIRGGNNIHAADVEAVLYQHPAVKEVAVAAVPHDVLGEDVGAWVVLHDDSDLLTGAKAPEVAARTLMDFCSEHLADYKCPRSVTFMEELPRNPTGKVLKRDLPPATRQQ
jgi:acyl-CoA synthetase (AMP-forming)/AMP-acid ligase II